MKIIDWHCDTISALMDQRFKGLNSELLANDNHLDLQKMQKGDYMLQCFAMFVPLTISNPWQTCLDLIALYEQEIQKNEEIIRPVLHFSDIAKNALAGKMSALLTVEEGGVTEGSIERLHELYNLGVRLITLTWNFPNAIGNPNIQFDETTKRPISFVIPNTETGLTEQGVKFVQEMERLGMIIDVSHLSDRGFYDCLAVTTSAVIIASHSNARTVASNIRNLTDDMIIKLAARGGIMGINYCSAFMSNRNDDQTLIADIVSHIKYIRDLAGIDCIALGSDFDGIGGKLEMANAGELPKLVDALRENGFSEMEINKITHENALRVLKQALK